jgi:hypothetical protein
LLAAFELDAVRLYNYLRVAPMVVLLVVVVLTIASNYLH